MYEEILEIKKYLIGFLMLCFIIACLVGAITILEEKQIPKATMETTISPTKVYTEYKPEAINVSVEAIKNQSLEKRKGFEAIIEQTTSYDEAALAKLKIEALDKFDEEFDYALSWEKCYETYPEDVSKQEQIDWVKEYFKTLEIEVIPKYEVRLNSIKM